MKIRTLAVSLFVLSAVPGLALACPPGGANQGPPPEATAACSGAAENQACEFEAPHGTVAGTCQNIQDQIACVPAGGPPQGGPGGQGGQGGQGRPPTQSGQIPQGA